MVVELLDLNGARGNLYINQTYVSLANNALRSNVKFSPIKSKIVAGTNDEITLGKSKINQWTIGSLWSPVWGLETSLISWCLFNATHDMITSFLKVE